MHTISFNIDENTKKKIENYIEVEGMKNIEEFILKAIEDELFLHESLLKETDINERLGKETEKEEEIRLTLLKLAEDLSKIREHEKKVKYLANFDNFFKENLDTIKGKYSTLVNGVLRSL